jgi:hypothetical protein
MTETTTKTRIERAQELGVEFELRMEPETMEVRGNVMASGDDDFDRVVEDEILDRLDNGDEWAWCIVAVEARYAGLVGRDSLGGCSYKDEDNFCQPGGYYQDMQECALDDLLAEAEAAHHAWGHLSNLDD